MKKIFLILMILAPIGFDAQAKSPPPGNTKVWQQPPASTQQLDLFWGPGSEAEQPVGPFTFVEDDSHGTQTKFFVTDQRGVRWNVKFGKEVHAEVVASRLLWATGYPVDEMYLVPEGVVQNLPKSGIDAKYIDSSGAFKNARFRRTGVRGQNIASSNDYFGAWGWESAPFKDSKEYSGLVLMNVLMSNFDTKNGNNMVRSVKYQDGTVDNWYMVGDIGATFGKTEVYHSKWNIEDFSKGRLVRDSDKDSVQLNFQGTMTKYFQSIPKEHAQWIYEYLGNLTREQIEDAFRSGFGLRQSPLPNPEDEATVKAFSTEVLKRVAELKDALNPQG